MDFGGEAFSTSCVSDAIVSTLSTTAMRPVCCFPDVKWQSKCDFIPHRRLELSDYVLANSKATWQVIHQKDVSRSDKEGDKSNYTALKLSLCRGILGIAVQWRNLSLFGYSFSEETLEHRFCSKSSSVSLSAALPEWV